MNPLHPHPEMMMGIAMFLLLSATALIPLALAVFSKEEEDDELL